MPGQIQRIKNRVGRPMIGLQCVGLQMSSINFLITKNKDGCRRGGGKTQQMNHPPAHSEDKFGIGGTV